MKCENGENITTEVWYRFYFVVQCSANLGRVPRIFWKLVFRIQMNQLKHETINAFFIYDFLDNVVINMLVNNHSSRTIKWSK